MTDASPARRPGPRWPLVLSLVAVALPRPLASAAGLHDAVGRPLGPLLVTGLVALVWVAVVVVRQEPRPVEALAAAGLGYGAVAVALDLVVQPVVRGDGGEAMPAVGVLAVLATNAVWGAALGLVAATLLRWRGVSVYPQWPEPREERPPAR